LFFSFASSLPSHLSTLSLHDALPICPPICVEPGGRAVIEIHRRTLVLCVFGVCVKSALSSGPRPARKQRRGEALAASTVARDASRHFVRGPACLRILSGLFLASAY